MLTLLSPAKKLDMTVEIPAVKNQKPVYIKQASNLIKLLHSKSKLDIMQLMSISESLAELNIQRYKNWSSTHDVTNSFPAIYAFRGDVYQGFNADTLSLPDIEFANDNIRILSGLYGILKPLDLIHPYRLEMGSKLINEHGKNLYEFWQQEIVQLINQHIAQDQNEKIVINLASVEYFKAVNKKALEYKVVTPIFKDFSRDKNKYQVINFYAKKARGMMARFIVKNKLNTVQALKNFNDAGYAFQSKLSDKESFVFTRKLAQ